MEMESGQIALACNDEYIASIVINTSENPQHNEALLSDDDFAQELQLQEVIISSLINQPPKTGESSKPAAEEGSAESSQSLCEICAEKKDGDSMFPLPGCTHRFCNDCISRHISIKVTKRAIVDAAAALACPGAGCGGALGAAACRAVVPAGVVAAWDEVLCEAAIAVGERVYCPYKNCSALLVDDGGGGVITEAECPFCRRLFCARCNVAPWHAGVDCEGFSKLGKDEREGGDMMVHDLAKTKKWRRCPGCNFYVEKNEGCLHIICRCRYEFCYACGKAWSSTHGGCQ
ncbi:RBR-type E3 ubiquitin transferase [Salvia divinorum]|uniref:RBR-type E3 ubiquitin transferase n=1 Tax=Salvia divinorum TaxID=28513 RepID=A0ABD1HDN3_SALDI